MEKQSWLSRALLTNTGNVCPPRLRTAAATSAGPCPARVLGGPDAGAGAYFSTAAGEFTRDAGGPEWAVGVCLGLWGLTLPAKERRNVESGDSPWISAAAHLRDKGCGQLRQPSRSDRLPGRIRFRTSVLTRSS